MTSRTRSPVRRSPSANRSDSLLAAGRSVPGIGTTYHLIEPLRACEVNASAGGHSFFARQGDLDGACGPYSLYMALAMLGVVDLEHLAPNGSGIDGRTRAGRLLSALKSFSPLIQQGTGANDLQALAPRLGREVRLRDTACRGRALSRWIRQSLAEGHPVILGLDYRGKRGHWVLAVGYRCNSSYREVRNGNPSENLEAFLLIDPSALAPTLVPWNAQVRLGTGASRGLKDSHDTPWREPVACRISEAHAVTRGMDHA